MLTFRNKNHKPQTKSVAKWDRDSMETLNGSLLCTDWVLFHQLELDAAAEAITDYKKLCADGMVTKKDIVVYRNNKKYITKDVKVCINRKNIAFMNKDEADGKVIQEELNQFAYIDRKRRGTDDAVASITQLTIKHLEDPQAYAHILFVDFS